MILSTGCCPRSWFSSQTNPLKRAIWFSSWSSQCCDYNHLQFRWRSHYQADSQCCYHHTRWKCIHQDARPILHTQLRNSEAYFSALGLDWRPILHYSDLGFCFWMDWWFLSFALMSCSLNLAHDCSCCWVLRHFACSRGAEVFHLVFVSHLIGCWWGLLQNCSLWDLVPRCCEFEF